MGKPSSTSDDTSAINSLAQQMTATGSQSAQQGQTLFNLALPGLEQTSSYYGKLASGDPTALARANAPAIQQIGEASDSAKKNIIQDDPRGGQRNLALENADISKGAQVSNLTTQSYTNAFPSMAGLSGQNVSQGNAATNTGLSGMNSAANQYGNLAQLNNEQKATQLGLLGSLGGAAGTAVGGVYCWVAMAYWGDFDPRTLKVRRWLRDVYGKTLFGGIFVRAYSRYGRRLASHFDKPAVRFALCPLFDQFLLMAEGA